MRCVHLFGLSFILKVDVAAETSSSKTETRKDEKIGEIGETGLQKNSKQN